MAKETYHRLATGKMNQDFYTALSQVSTGEVWGTRATYGNNFPTVRAFPGPLPDGQDGVEFSTFVPPTPGASTKTEAYWKLHEQSPQVQASDDGDFARIKATILKVRYTKAATLKPRCEWSPP